MLKHSSLTKDSKSNREQSSFIVLEKKLFKKRTEDRSERKTQSNSHLNQNIRNNIPKHCKNTGSLRQTENSKYCIVMIKHSCWKIWLSMMGVFSHKTVFQKLSQQPNRGLNHCLYRKYQTFPLTLDKYCAKTTGVVYSNNRSKLLPSPRAKTEQNDDGWSSAAILLSDQTIPNHDQ